jgi:hypothetical protein
MTLAAVATNVPVETPFAIGTADGTVRFALLLTSEIPLKPTAGLVTVTVHALVELGPRLVGLQVSDNNRTGVTRLIVAPAEVEL